MKHIYRIKTVAPNCEVLTLGEYKTFYDALKASIDADAPNVIEYYDVIFNHVEWRTCYTNDWNLVCDKCCYMTDTDLVLLINAALEPALDYYMELLKRAISDGFELGSDDWITSENFTNRELFKAAARYLGYELQE